MSTVAGRTAEVRPLSPTDRAKPLPDPLVPPECDLRNFHFMPLDVVRLRDSGLTAKATGDEFRAAVLLWCASWHQIPAASLPDDDDELASICGYSRARPEWEKVRDGALRGWRKCNDGRLYHRRVASKALEAWIEKLASAIGGASGNVKRWGVSIDTQAMRGQFTSAVVRLRALDPQSRTLRKKAVAVITMPSGSESPPESPPESQDDSGPYRKGHGHGHGHGQGSNTLSPSPSGKAPEGDGSGSAEPTPADDEASDGRTTFLACPYDELIALYHRLMPDNPRVEVLNEARKRLMKARWREWHDSKRQHYGTPPTHAAAIDFWTRFFAFAAQSPWLTGKVPPQPGRPQFVADIEFLFGGKHASIVEGKYHDKIDVEIPS